LKGNPTKNSSHSQELRGGGGGETPTTNLGNGLDFRAQFVLDAVQGKAIFVRDQVDGNAQVTKPTRTTDSVQVRLGHLRKIEIDDHIDSLNVDTTSKQV
jgi:hypothetical protein